MTIDRSVGSRRRGDGGGASVEFPMTLGRRDAEKVLDSAGARRTKEPALGCPQRTGSAGLPARAGYGAGAAPGRKNDERDARKRFERALRRRADGV